MPDESAAAAEASAAVAAAAAAAESARRDSVGAWAKHYHLASRALMEATLREHGLGPTQWYVLYQLVNDGSTTQRELGLALKIERATMSGVVATLVRKGLVSQVPDAVDQRQRILSITAAGRALWADLPDPVGLATTVSFEGADPAELAVARRVLKAATARLVAHMAADGSSAAGSAPPAPPGAATSGH